jgi:hypothetical protein
MLNRKAILMLAVLMVLVVAPVLSSAQDTAAPSFTPGQLDKLVARIALYPDSLLVQVLAAATVSRPDSGCGALGRSAPLPYRASSGRRDPGGSSSVGSERAGAPAIPFSARDDGQRHELDHRYTGETDPTEERNVPDLLSLQAGVAYTRNRADNEKNQVRDQDTRSGSVNGARSDRSNITLDGVDVNDQSKGYAFTSVLPVTLDSVQEFRVTT